MILYGPMTVALEFQPPQYPRGKVLDTWTAQRCTMPLRSYEKQVRGPDGER